MIKKKAKKLTLNKESLLCLDQRQLREVAGASAANPNNCPSIGTGCTVCNTADTNKTSFC